MFETVKGAPMKLSIIQLVAITLLLASPVVAGQGEDIKQDKKEIGQDVAELKWSKECLDRLSVLLDRWHEAYLAGDEKQAHQYEQAIVNMLVKDINATFHAVGRAEREKAASGVCTREDAPAYIALDDDRDLARIRVLLAGKQSLLYRLKKNESFSLKYRALANYQELLRKELGMVAVELSEDSQQQHHDLK
jgi:hypothetical protein